MRLEPHLEATSTHSKHFHMCTTDATWSSQGLCQASTTSAHHMHMLTDAAGTAERAAAERTATSDQQGASTWPTDRDPQHMLGARAARAAESLQPPPHGYALPRPPCPSTHTGNLRRSTVADHNRRLALPQSSRSPYGDYAFGDSEAHTRHRGAQGPENRQTRCRRTAVGLAVAARAGGCGRPRASFRGCPAGRREEEEGERR